MEERLWKPLGPNRHLLALLLTTLAALSFSYLPTACGEVFFVSPDPPPHSNCTRDFPCSWAEAVAQVANGDVLRLVAGTYPNPSRRDFSSIVITIEGASENLVTLDFSAVAAGGTVWKFAPGSVLSGLTLANLRLPLFQLGSNGQLNFQRCSFTFTQLTAPWTLGAGAEFAFTGGSHIGLAYPSSIASLFVLNAGSLLFDSSTLSATNWTGPVITGKGTVTAKSATFTTTLTPLFDLSGSNSKLLITSGSFGTTGSLLNRPVVTASGGAEVSIAGGFAVGHTDPSHSAIIFNIKGSKLTAPDCRVSAGSSFKHFALIEDLNGSPSTVVGKFSISGCQSESGLFKVRGSTLALWPGTSIASNRASNPSSFGSVINLDDFSQASINDAIISGNGGGASVLFVGQSRDCRSLLALNITEPHFSNNDGKIGGLCFGREEFCELDKPLSSPDVNCYSADPCAWGDGPPSVNCSTATTTCQYDNFPGIYSCKCLPEFPEKISPTTCQKFTSDYFASPNANPSSDMNKCHNSSHPCNLLSLLNGVESGSQIFLSPGTFALSNASPFLFGSRDITIIQNNSADVSMLDFGGTGRWTTGGNLRFQNLRLRGLPAPWLDVVDQGTVSFTNCKILDSNFTSGASIVSITGAGEASLAGGSEVRGLHGPQGSLFALGPGSNLFVTETIFSNNSLDVIVRGTSAGLVGVTRTTVAGNSGGFLALTLTSDKSLVIIQDSDLTGNVVKSGWLIAASGDGQALVWSGLTLRANSGPLVSLSGGQLSLTNVTFTSNHANSTPALTTRGTLLKASYWSCVNNTGAAGCWKIESFGAARALSHTIADSVVSANSALLPPATLSPLASLDYCAAAIHISDSNSKLTFNKTTLEGNRGKYGVFCVVDAGCGTSVAFQASRLISPDTITPRPWSFFYFQPPTQRCPSNSYTFDATTEKSPGTPDSASYPASVLLPTTTHSTAVAENTTANTTFSWTFAVTFADLWAVPVDSTRCEGFLVCFRPDPPLRSTVGSLAFCNTTSTLSLQTNTSSSNTAAPIDPGASNSTTPVATAQVEFVVSLEDALAAAKGAPELTVQIHFGASTCDVSVDPGALRVAQPGAATWAFTLPTPKSSPSDTPSSSTTLPIYAIALIVVGGVVLVAGAVGIGLWRALARRRPAFSTKTMREPLLSNEGVMLADLVAEMLSKAKIPIVPPEEIEIESVIGEGATGVVVVGKWAANNGVRVAVKQLHTVGLVAEGWSESNKNQLSELVTEVAVMVQLSHPNLLPLLGCCVINSADVRLIMPYMSKGNLAGMIDKIPREQVLSVVRQMAWGLEYLHGKNLIHRDIKPENVLMDEEEEGDLHVYLADFALSRRVTTATMTAAFVGTPAYMAPEVVSSGEGEMPADVYAWAVICLELITQTRVYGGMRPMLIMQKVSSEGLAPTIPEELLKDESRPSWVPAILISLLQRSFSRDPAPRPTFPEICAALKSY